MYEKKLLSLRAVSAQLCLSTVSDDRELNAQSSIKDKNIWEGDIFIEENENGTRCEDLSATNLPMNFAKTKNTF